MTILAQNEAAATTTNPVTWWGYPSVISVTGDVSPATVQIEQNIDGIGFAPINGQTYTATGIDTEVNLPAGELRVVITGTPTSPVSVAISNQLPIENVKVR